MNAGGEGRDVARARASRRCGPVVGAVFRFFLIFFSLFLPTYLHPLVAAVRVFSATASGEPRFACTKHGARHVTSRSTVAVGLYRPGEQSGRDNGDDDDGNGNDDGNNVVAAAAAVAARGRERGSSRRHRIIDIAVTKRVERVRTCRRRFP